MRISDIPFNMEILVDGSLKERPGDFDEMRKGIDFILAKVDQEESRAVRASLHSLSGKYLRIVNQLDDSEGQLIHAFEDFRELELFVPAVIAKFRLGLTYLYQERFSKADDFLNKALESSLKSKDKHLIKLIDHVYFALGLSKLWQKNAEEAEKLFSECLELRIVKGDLALISICEKALVYVAAV
ncbi:MAG: hypothetical protein BM556_02010 [Bacteriovorax sp. MedPE-SWde]|nr:MAG: hypothetical protein BM556_02010 [Bacteriovorax sp. MedPE-SWde]